MAHFRCRFCHQICAGGTRWILIVGALDGSGGAAFCDWRRRRRHGRLDCRSCGNGLDRCRCADVGPLHHGRAPIGHEARLRPGRRGSPVVNLWVTVFTSVMVPFLQRVTPLSRCRRLPGVRRRGGCLGGVSAGGSPTAGARRIMAVRSWRLSYGQQAGKAGAPRLADRQIAPEPLSRGPARWVGQRDLGNLPCHWPCTTPIN